MIGILKKFYGDNLLDFYFFLQLFLYSLSIKVLFIIDGLSSNFIFYFLLQIKLRNPFI